MKNFHKWRSKWLLLNLALPIFAAAQWTALDPGFNANRSVVVQDHELFVASYLTGIKVSDDNGLTWSDRNSGLPAPGGHIYVESVGSDGTWLYAGTHDGIFRSNDAGVNWNGASGAIPISSDNYTDRFLSFGNVTFAIMSTDPFNSGGMFRTDNHGLTWNIGHSGMLGCGKIQGLMMYEGILYASATGGLYSSDDLGLNWTQVSGFNFLYDHSISEDDPFWRVAGGQFGLSYSHDGGDTWQNANGPSGYDRVEIRHFNGQFIAIVKGNDHGIWSSTTGENWTKMSGLSAMAELSLEDSYQFGQVLYVGTLMNMYKMNGSGISIAPRVFLGAAFDSNTGKMRDDLRVQGIIPLEEPFSMLGYAQFGDGGGELTTHQSLTATNNDAIVDWVLVELRDKNDESIILETQSALVQSDGDVVNTNAHGPVIFDTPIGDYFISIRHRDHLGVMTQGPLALSPLPRPVDFTSGNTATYGSDARMYNAGEWMLWPGNVNNDGVLRFAGANNDRDAILQKLGSSSSTATLSGYHPEDVNMDGVVSYDGLNNDRSVIQSIIGLVPTKVLLEQLP